MGSHRRMHAVGADQEIALGAGAVRKVRDHALIGAVLDADQPLVKEQLDILAPGLVHDRFVEGGTAHVHCRLTETLLHVLVDAAEPVSGLRIEIECFRDRAAADHFVGEAGRGKHVHAVRRNLQAAADARGIGPSLEHLRLKTGLPQQDGGDGAGNAGADDEGFAGSSRHVLLLMSRWGKKLSLLIILANKILNN